MKGEEMKKSETVFIPIIMLFLLNFLITNDTKNTLSISNTFLDNGKNYEWVSDGTSLDGWSQCEGNSIYEASIVNENPSDPRHSYEYAVKPLNSAFTPEGKENSIGYWNPNSIGDYYHYAGIFRQENELSNSSTWLVNLTVTFNAAFQNYASFAGDLAITIDNENNNPMFRVRLRDASGRANEHQVRAIVDYWNASGTVFRPLITDPNRTDYEINSGTFSVMKNGSQILALFPEEIPNGSGWRNIGNSSLLLQRGTPTYIRIHFSRWEMRPEENRIENVFFTTIDSTSIVKHPLISPNSIFPSFMACIALVITTRRKLHL
jgi:hypothetical protein